MGTRHIQEVQQGGKDYSKDLALLPYSGVATGNNNLGGDETTNEQKEQKSSQGKGGQAGSRFG